MGKIEHRLVFNAPIQKVWDAIVGYESYGEWNKFCPQVEFDLRRRGKIRMHAHLFPNEKPTVQTERFRKIEEPNLVTYGIDYGILMYTERSQELIALSSTKTEYQSCLRIVGMLAPFVMWKYREAIDQGFRLSYVGLEEYLAK
ncbi:MAG: hypothetical protein ACI97X_001044 [Oceanospirillaceae bacterium]|jgi:uncharacterized protein YndB with AHSA1/START domain